VNAEQERGAEVFEEWLIDHETACNAGNWQWLSCTAFISQFYRCYSPIAFPKNWDKEGDFVRRYVPELKDLDAKFIYEPWKAPIADQKAAGVRIQGDGKSEEVGKYPKPMFDFNERRTVCLAAMKKAYDIGLYGNDERVIDGSWRALFPDDAEGPTEGSSFADAMEGGKGADEKGKHPMSGSSATKPKKDQSVGAKRKKGQATLDGLVKRSKK
jgi:cryptochrome